MAMEEGMEKKKRIKEREEKKKKKKQKKENNNNKRKKKQNELDVDIECVNKKDPPWVNQTNYALTGKKKNVESVSEM